MTLANEPLDPGVMNLDLHLIKVVHGQCVFWIISFGSSNIRKHFSRKLLLCTQPSVHVYVIPSGVVRQILALYTCASICAFSPDGTAFCFTAPHPIAFKAENCVTHYLGRCGTRHCILFDNCQTEVIELVECELYMFKIDSICPFSSYIHLFVYK